MASLPLNDNVGKIVSVIAHFRLRMATDVETDLTMVVRYFMRFGAKRGRDELTLQVGEYTNHYRLVHARRKKCIQHRFLTRYFRVRP